MRDGMFKEVYRGECIYWYGKDGYGDLTKNILTRTLAECRAMVDAHLSACEKPTSETEAAEAAHWRTLSDAQKRHYRRECMETDMSASELAYACRESVSTL